MSELPASIKNVLSDPAYVRKDPSAVKAALEQLGAPVSDAFRTLYETYGGPFAGQTGHQLLDLVDQELNVLTASATCRSEHGFPSRYLVITDMVALSVLAYDTHSDAVFDVDFEGGDRELIAGKLEPRWRAFEEFLVEHFS